MAASSVQNPVVRSESKSAKKKKAKLENTTSNTTAMAATEPAPSTTGEPVNGDTSYESPYIKELYKLVIVLSFCYMLARHNSDCGTSYLAHAPKANT